LGKIGRLITGKLASFTLAIGAPLGSLSMRKIGLFLLVDLIGVVEASVPTEISLILPIEIFAIDLLFCLADLIHWGFWMRFSCMFEILMVIACACGLLHVHVGYYMYMLHI
jgi:hypothetical protein